ncbi:MAG: S8 family serine peptidase [Burkholderiales bacterium]
MRLRSVGAGQYEVLEVEPGAGTLDVSRAGFRAESYAVQLRRGANRIQVVLGKRGEPYYYARGYRIYFQPVAGQFLIAAHGKNALGLTSDSLARRKLNAHSVSGEGALGPAVHDSCFLRIDVSPAQGSLERGMQAVSRDLAKRGLDVTPALIVGRGKGPIQGLTNELFVKFEDGVSEKEATRIASRFRLKVKRRVLSSGNAYLMTTGRMPSYRLLETARQLREKHPVIAAEPELLSEAEVDQYSPNDPLFNLLTHLPLINCDDAWELLGTWDQQLRGGSPQICIAVFDPQGVTPDHPDLTANLTDGASKLQTSFNFQAMNAQTVAALGGDHGTQCAGAATAVFDNNQGIAGVAANCRLIGARLPNPSTGTQMADAFLWAAGIDNGNTTPGFPALPAQPADVISNSWGNSNTALSQALQDAFDRLTDDGREGRGCVVTFSTGNLGYVQFSNVRQYAAYDRNVAVGASINVNPTSPVNSDQADPNGNTQNIAVTVDTRAFYNPFGPEMDIVAPSHTCYTNNQLTDPTTSTVRVGTGAIDGCPGAPVCNDYATSFGGTSHASPTIAGTAALVLSANPLLGWDEARDILRRTAVRIDFNNADPTGQYVDNDGDGAAEFSQWYGYGRVDVAAAAQEALLLWVAELYVLSSIATS